MSSEDRKIVVAIVVACVIVFGLIFAWVFYMVTQDSAAVGSVSIEPDGPAVTNPLCRSRLPGIELSLGNGTFTRGDTRLRFGFKDDLDDDWTVVLLRPNKERLDYTRGDCSVFNIRLRDTGDVIMGAAAVGGAVSLQCRKGDYDALRVELSELYCHSP